MSGISTWHDRNRIKERVNSRTCGYAVRSFSNTGPDRSFMALGAARLSRAGVLTKQPQTVESLGSATVICTDKTGTITQEGMRVRQLYEGVTDALVELLEVLSDRAGLVLEYARWSSETAPFDAMGKSHRGRVQHRPPRH